MNATADSLMAVLGFKRVGNGGRFPWPPSILSPNARAHWAQKSRAAKKYRADCALLTKQFGLSVDWDGPVDFFIEFFPPDRRHRDDDNLIASFKSGRDGIAQALGIDDRRFRLAFAVSEQVGGYVLVTVRQPS